MSLRGAVSARRRRASHGRSAALLQPHVRLTKPIPCEREEDAGARNHVDDGLHRVAMAARRRLDEKLRIGCLKTGKVGSQSSQADSPSTSPKHVGSSSLSSSLQVRAAGWTSRALKAVLPDSQSHFRRAGNEMVQMSVCAGQSGEREEKVTRAMAGSVLYVQEECPICLDSFLPGHEVMCLPCSHTFHTTCVLPWLRVHSHCPFCRAKI